ncbi:MAG: 30S ribosomal protein S13 [Candidatus ainarchaeum sp.]|nr:30S ribosomal protein S13 [Candidatus ainarchaeum sp.]
MVENLIVRIIGKDLDGTKNINESIMRIKGISHRMGKIISTKFCKEQKLSQNTKLGDLTIEQIKELEKIVQNLEKTSIPKWTLNRQKEYETGESKHLTMNDLDFQLRNDFQRLVEIKSYRGLRHIWGLPVRGQKTRSTHRGKGKGKVIGVSKKDNLQGKKSNEKKE